MFSADLYETQQLQVTCATILVNLVVTRFSIQENENIIIFLIRLIVYYQINKNTCTDEKSYREETCILHPVKHVFK